MYKDVSGLFTNKVPDEFTYVPCNSQDPEHKSEVENEDDLLYGDESEFKMPTLNIGHPRHKACYNWWKKYLADVRPTYWLFIVRDNSNLEIYSVPDFKLCFIVRNLCFGYKVLVDSLESVPIPLDALSVMNETTLQDRFPVKEILMVGLGNKGSRPLLLVRLEKDFYIYEVFRFAKGNLKLRFRKMNHNMMYSSNLEGRFETENADYFMLQERISRMRYFTNIAGNCDNLFIFYTLIVPRYISKVTAGCSFAARLHNGYF